ncbi:DUF4913 domain-containing protein [Nocardia otitidiscaviarum]|uniref:DUF4913 domain-containing protein n=1 Tax=Nocardia otitidiscaviarum TaxID=1823 RepID=UPI000694E019|nr:DUF4913 domain-containing protein [Nocardia otitidiscaviarum]MBF6137762.1 DUF4913 domain-containing protein [Nocardia otitidiscaviarum]MBF6485283.1 DUF4913 domain-containing protein [Nocardia otitidiscaviarum]
MSTDESPDPELAELRDQLASLSEALVELRTQNRLLTTKVERVDATAARSAQGLDEFETALGVLADRMAATAPAEAAAAGATASTTAGSGGATAAGAVPAGADLDQIDMDVLLEWVIANIGEWAQRKLPRSTTSTANGAICWCSEWYEHPEAVTNLWALRRAWLEAVVQPGAAMAVYLRDFFYPTIRNITDPAGPFYACTPDSHDPEAKFVPVVPAGFRQ